MLEHQKDVAYSEEHNIDNNYVLCMYYYYLLLSIPSCIINDNEICIDLKIYQNKYVYFVENKL